MNGEKIAEILANCKTVAIVGLSRDPDKDSNRVGKYLKDQGYRIVPINPTAEEILGEKSYKNLLEMPEELQKTIEVVDIFRPSKEALSIVEQAIQLKKRHGVPHVVWMQLGIVNDEAAELARNVGLKVVMDRCMMQQHLRLFAKKQKITD